MGIDRKGIQITFEGSLLSRFTYNHEILLLLLVVLLHLGLYSILKVLVNTAGKMYLKLCQICNTLLFSR